MPAPLPPLIEPEPKPGDDLFSPEIMAEITNQEQKHGIYTAKRFEKLRPEQAKVCIKFLSSGMPAQEIARALNVSDRTVVAMADAHADEITDLEKHLAKKLRRCAHYLVERVERNPGIIPAQAIGQTVKQFFETAQLADGRPTEIIEETKRLDIYAHWERFVAGDEIGLTGGKIPVRDAELVELEESDGRAGVTRAHDARDQDSTVGSGLSSDESAPVPQVNSGLATFQATPPSETRDQDALVQEASIGTADPRGGDPVARARGRVANDNGSQKIYANGDP